MCFDSSGKAPTNQAEFSQNFSGGLGPAMGGMGVAMVKHQGVDPTKPQSTPFANFKEGTTFNGQPEQTPAAAPAPDNRPFSTQPMGGAAAPAFQPAAQQPTAPPSNVAGTFSQFGPRPGGSGRVVN